MLHVNVTVNDTGAVNLPDLRSTLDTIAADWTTEIRQRTRSGKGADGRQMRRRVDGSPARLTDSGAMLKSLSADVDDKGFRLAPSGTRNTIVARTHQRSRRQFMGASPDQIEDARAAVVEALRNTK